MAISHVGSGVSPASTNANTITVPAHSVGDLILIAASRFGSTAAPSLPAGYTSIGTASVGGTYASSIRVGYKVATSASDTSGTWTNALAMAVGVFAGIDPVAIVGGHNLLAAANTSANYGPAITAMTVTDGSSWVWCPLSAATIGGTPSFSVPAGLTQRAVSTAAGGGVLDTDSNGGVSSWGNHVQTISGISVWLSASVEILAGASTTDGAGSIAAGAAVAGVGARVIASVGAISVGAAGSAVARSIKAAAAAIAAGVSGSGVGRRTVPASAAIAATGAVSGAGQRTQPGAASVSGGATVAGHGQHTQPAAGTLASSVTPAGTGRRIATAAGSISGGLMVLGTARAIIAAAGALSAGVTLAGAAQVIVPSVGTILGGASILGQGATATGTTIISAAGVISASAAAAGAGQRTVPSAGTIVIGASVAGASPQASGNGSGIDWLILYRRRRAR